MLIQKYNPLWREYFQELKNEIQNALSGLEIKIEHIGSTSIKGLAAKPIIDIDIIFYHSKDFQKIKTRLSNIGYYHNGDQGIPQREVFKRKDLIQKHPVLDKHKHHLYVCINNSKELQRHLLFRNFLRKNEWAKKEYEQIKFDIAQKANQDRKKYAEIKETNAKSWIQSIIDQAELELKKEM